MKFKLEIITPFGRYFQGEIEILNVYTEEQGQLGIMANHAPMIAHLDIAPINYKVDHQTYWFALGGGLLYVDNYGAILVANSIEADHEINVKRAKQKLKKIEKEIKLKSAMREDYQIDIDKANNRIRVAEGDYRWRSTISKH